MPSPTLFLIRIIAVTPVDRVPQLGYHREQQHAWLKQWTCVENFKVRVGPEEDKEIMINSLLFEAMECVKSHPGFAHGNLAVTIGTQAVESGVFWHNAAGLHSEYLLVDCNPIDIATKYHRNLPKYAFR